MRVPWVWNQDLTTVALEMPEWPASLLCPVLVTLMKEESGVSGLEGISLSLESSPLSLSVCLHLCVCQFCE